MPIPVKYSHHNRENETTTDPPRTQSSNNFLLLKVMYGSRLVKFRCYQRATTSNDLSTYIREAFDIPANRTFRLIGEDNTVFILTPIDFDDDEIFRLEIDPPKSVLSNTPTPPMQARHSWKYYGKLLLMAIFACQNGILIGILSAEFGLFSSLSTSGTSNTRFGDEFQHTLVVKNTTFGIK
ncbi:hypothetical protein I4U23_021792 [Adineta vaga]|nr:hypothetical protein I4U23_021792 [Adineta vaga]